jgi:hypothetical protein
MKLDFDKNTLIVFASRGKRQERASVTFTGVQSREGMFPKCSFSNAIYAIYALA